MSSAGDTTKPKLISQKVDASYHVVITCDVEVDLSNPELNVDFPLEDVPLAGLWKLRLKRINEADAIVKVILRYGNLPEGRLGRQLDVLSSAFFSVAGGIATQMRSGSWIVRSGDEVLPGRDGEKVFSSLSYSVALADLKQPSCSSAHRWYRFVFTLKQSNAELDTLDKTREGAASRLSDLHLEQVPAQIRLFFPNLSEGGAELWVSSDLLAKVAPYFKDLLSSDFSEANPRRSKRARKSGAQPLAAPATNEKDFDDSDDETDAFLLTKKPPKLSESTEACEHPYREITITQTSFTTYHALLVYLETGYVRFAPLRSASSPSNPSASSSRDDFLSEHFKDNPSFPFPISPKSMYRLADLLRLPDSDPLSSLCLTAFASSLTHHGAALELFSDASICFDKIRKVALDYVVKDWEAVSETASWKETAERIKAGEMPDAAPVLMELMQAREEAAKTKG